MAGRSVLRGSVLQGGGCDLGGFRQRNRPDYVENGGHIRGAVSRLPRKVARVCDTRLLQDVPAYEMRHKSNFYLNSFRSNRPPTCWS